MTRFLAAAAVMMASAWLSPANATLIGDQITGTLTKPNFPGLQIFSSTSATVTDPGEEFSGVAGSFNFGGTSARNDAFANFTGDTVTIGFRAVGPDNLSDPGNPSAQAVHFVWSFSDLQWLGQPGQITGLTLLDATPNFVFASNNPGWSLGANTPANFVVNTTPTSFTIGTPGYVYPPNFAFTEIFATYRIETTHVLAAAIPEPATGAIFALGLGALTFLRRRRHSR